MATATITSKGQVTIPVSVRLALGLESGSRIEFIETEKGKFSIVPANSSILELKGMLRKPAKAVSIDDMNMAIALQGAKAR
jgi:AbrB family looped-hinge helix DNA binding protein